MPWHFFHYFQLMRDCLLTFFITFYSFYKAKRFLILFYIIEAIDAEKENFCALRQFLSMSF